MACQSAKTLRRGRSRMSRMRSSPFLSFSVSRVFVDGTHALSQNAAIAARSLSGTASERDERGGTLMSPSRRRCLASRTCGRDVERNVAVAASLMPVAGEVADDTALVSTGLRNCRPAFVEAMRLVACMAPRTLSPTSCAFCASESRARFTGGGDEPERERGADGADVDGGGGRESAGLSGPRRRLRPTVAVRVRLSSLFARAVVATLGPRPPRYGGGGRMTAGGSVRSCW